MKIQKQLSKKRGNKTYYKYVIVLPEMHVKESGLTEGEELYGETKNGEITLKRKKKE
ncbi:MAG: hypothetical protein UR15_C0001G0003 [Parcubacteria group bacterium GW2011_GWA2_31_28]|nr:MAG: hypothetical protein UR15_C0001G0003 [Parcubacteria group bacterium GW2011_GWA2_31_28]